MKENSLRWIFSATKKQQISVWILALLQAVLGGSSVLYAFLLRETIDAAAEKNWNHFLMSFLWIGILIVSQILLRAIARWLEEWCRVSIENTLCSRLFETLLKKEYAAVTAVHSGDWLNRLNSDTKIIADGIVDIFPGITGMAVRMFGALAMLLLIVPKFLWILIPGGILLIILTYAFRKILKRLHKVIQEKEGKLRIFLQEHLGSLIVIKTFSAEEKAEKECQCHMQEYQDARIRRTRFSNFCNVGFAAAMNGMYLLGLGYCSAGIIEGTLSYGTLMAVLQLIAQIQSPFANITGYFPKFYAMTASADRLREAENFLDTYQKASKTSMEIKQFYKTEFSEIAVQDISFSYTENSQEMVLRHWTEHICKGENIAFLGHSGCGKSTVLKLLLGLYHCSEGAILLKTKDGTEMPLTSEWHRLFAYVPQGNQLMCGTIRDIVAFADTKADEKRVWRALEIACADTFVKQLEKGIDTELGERGQGLSEGQMQRLAIARAIYSENPILLLDEATSALDNQTEVQVLENIRDMTDKTIIFVTHRTKALEICDRVISF